VEHEAMKALRYLLPLVLALGALTALWVRTTPEQRPPMVDPAASATYGDLVLDTADGTLKLTDFLGKGVVVYFGYTSCPDICPTTLQTTAAAFDTLTPEEQQQLALVFVSVDPERDELARLRDYARYFHPNFHGGSASPERVAAMASDWGVQYRRADSPGSAMAYTVDHSTQSFLVDKQGRMVRPIPHGTPAAEVAELLRGVL
jgi:protein SCO1/2